MKDEMTEELKPCPFCGGSAVLEWFESRKGFEAEVKCNGGCLCNIHTITHEDRKIAIDDAIAAWNRRTPAETVSREADGSITVAGRRYAEWPKNSWRGTPAQAVKAYEPDAEMVPACAYDAALADRNGLIRLLASLPVPQPQQTVARDREDLVECVNNALWVNSTTIELGDNRATGVMCSNFPKAGRDIVDRILQLPAPKPVSREEDPLGWPVSIFESVIRGWWETRHPDDFEYNLRVLDDLLRDLVKPWIGVKISSLPPVPSVPECWELLAKVHTIAAMNDGGLPGETMREMKAALEAYPEYRQAAAAIKGGVR